MIVRRIYAFSSELVTWIYSKVLNSDKMFCVNLARSDQTEDTQLVVKVDTIKLSPFSEFTNRGLGQTDMCLDSKVGSDIILHIHPATGPVPPFPSLNDIMTVLRSSNVLQVSVIGTRWGLWVLTNQYETVNTYLPSRDAVLQAGIRDDLARVDSTLKTTLGYKDYVDLTRPELMTLGRSFKQIAARTNLGIDLYSWPRLLQTPDKSVIVGLYDTIPVRPTIL